MPSIRKNDLQELKVPIFDEATMLALSQAEDMKVADALSLLNQIRRFGAYAEHLNTSLIGSQLEEKILNDFLNAGWPKEDLQMNNCKISYDNGKVIINKTSYFEHVDSTVWEFIVGGYQPCHRWLRERKGRMLSDEEIQHYKNMVSAIAFTEKQMVQIDSAVGELF